MSYGKRRKEINAPVEIRRLPLNLLRSHLYPVWSDLTREAIKDFQEEKPLPSAMVQIGAYMPPYRNALYGIQALEAARAQRQAFKDATGFRGSPTEMRRIEQITTIHTGNGSLKRIQHAVLGPNHREIPFHPRSAPPEEVQDAARAMYQAWRGRR